MNVGVGIGGGSAWVKVMVGQGVGGWCACMCGGGWVGHPIPRWDGVLVDGVEASGFINNSDRGGSHHFLLPTNLN